MIKKHARIMKKPFLNRMLNFIWANKWWWIVPLALALILLIIALVTGPDNEVTPFVYTYLN